VKNGWTALCAWLVTFVLGYFGLGGRLAERIEGMDPAMIPIYPSVLFAAAVIISIWLTVSWARTIGAKAQATADEPPKGLGRRRFLTGTAAVTGGVAGASAATVGRLSGWMTVTGPSLGAEVVTTDPNPLDSWLGSRVQGYRRLGRTGVEVSDISVGTGQIVRHPDPVGLLKTAMDRGVTYIDTSPDYAGTRSEEAIAKAIKGRRDDMFIATKFCTGDGHVRQGSSVAEYMRSIDESINRLGTDHVDLVHVHSCDSVARLMDPAVHEAFDRLKEQGKVRFLGVSTHTPNLEQVANAAIDSDRFDVMMLAYHHGAWPHQLDIIERAAAKDIGIVAMKTLKGAKHKGMEDFRGEANSYTQAAFKWVLSNPSVSCLVVSFFETQHVDEYLFASGAPLTTRDIATLDKYDHLIAGTHCFAHCGDCLDACPAGVAINDVLRHRMYFEDYGDQKQAMQLYAQLDKKADLCLSCSAPCTGACPQGVPIHQRTTEAHGMLTLA
jgi:predicted aldo/keto reductase-like oxidoreductase